MAENNEVKNTVKEGKGNLNMVLENNSQTENHLSQGKIPLQSIDFSSAMLKNEELNDNTESNNISSVPIKKKTISACSKCRQRHIKCDGNGEPCSRCTRLGIQCEYLEADKKVIISVKYLNKLQNQISKLKVENANLRLLSKNPQHNNIITSPSSSHKTPFSQLNANNSNYKNIETTDNSDTYDRATSEEKKNQEVIPPFLEKYGRMIHSRTGERLYIGSSSMTLFGLEINRIVAPMLTPNKPDASPESTSSVGPDNETILEKEGNAYRIMLGKTTSRPGIDVNFTLPSYSYAMLLVDSFISYNDGCFYFFNEGLVKENLRRIYNDADNQSFKPDYGIESLNKSKQNESTLETIWFCKLLLIFAIGEMYLGTANYLNGTKLSEKPKRKRQKNANQSNMPYKNDYYDQNNNSSLPRKHKSNGTKLPGSGFFNEASDLFTGLFASGSIDNCTREGGIEALLLYAFYLQVADCTAASYFYFGIALRASLLLGLHVDIGKDSLNRYELEHRRRLWWTVYMYERMLASKAGLPLSLTDEDISTELPNDFDMSDPDPGCENYIFPEAEFISNCVRITQINANILRKLYTRQPSSNILPVVHELVVSLLKWKKALPNEINCNYSATELNISRLVVNMMTEYFQGVNLAVRPLLFHFVLTNLKSSNPKEGKYLDLSKYSPLILTLLNASFQASINSIRSLWALVPENMVAMFGYMDREYLFNSTATLVLFNATFGVHEATYEHLDHALTLFTKMRNLGNHPATLRREQILKLISILDFNNAMSYLIKKHTDNLHAPSSSPNLDKSFGYNFTVNHNQPNEEVNIPQTQKMSNPIGFHQNADHSKDDQNNTSTSPDSYSNRQFSIESGNYPQQSLTPSQVYNMSIKNHFNNDNHNTINNNNNNDKSFKSEAQPFPNQATQSPNLLKNVGMSSISNIVNKAASSLNESNTLNSNNENLGILSPSFSLMFNQIDDLPEFEQLTSSSKDLELWKDVTDQAAWLQNDMGDEFGHLLDQNDQK